MIWFESGRLVQTEWRKKILVLIEGGYLMTKVPGKCAGYLVLKFGEEVG